MQLTIDREKDDPPNTPPRPEDRISCPDCGAPTRSAWRRDGRGVLRELLVCTGCDGVVRWLRMTTGDPPRD